MSTRLGKVVFLEDVLNRAVEQTKHIILKKNVNTDDLDETARQVGIGAVVFNELSNNRIKDYVFSWDKILNFDGETGPYVQYSHARAASVLRKADNVAFSGEKIDGSYLTSDNAYALTTLIMGLPSVISEAAQKYEPSIVTRHIVDIAQAFNKFYHDEHILVDDTAERKAKVGLCAAAKIALCNGLKLLGVATPDRM
jgi:arginyl-tRNA synthetase